MTEQQFLKQVLELACRAGWRVVHFRPAMTRRGDWVTRMDGHPGFPDVIAIRRGRMLVAELKVGYNKVTADQQRWLDEFRQTGAATYVWRPADFADIILLLTEGKEYVQS